MIKSFKQGDYVYVPSNVLMFLYDRPDLPGPQTDYKRSVRTKKPQHLMFIDQSNNSWIQVFYEGNLWTVEIDHVYEAGEEYER